MHGGWGRPEDWDLVKPLLEAQGLIVGLADLPSMRQPTAGLSDDVGYLRDLVERVGRDCVVCAHSYGGAVLTEAASADDGFAHLVYLAAFVAQTGESAFDLTLERPIEGALGLEFHDDGTCSIQSWAEDDGRYSPDALAFMKARPRRAMSVAAPTTPVSREGWREIPATYLVAEQDHVIHPETQRRMAALVGESRTVESDHFVQSVEPQAIADAVSQAAE